MKRLLVYVLTAVASLTVGASGERGGSLNLEITGAIVPNLMVGEAGPLWGRITVINRTEETVTAEARLVDDPEGRIVSEAGPAETLYPGLRRALRFPLRLKEPAEAVSNLVVRLEIAAGDDRVSLPAIVLARESGPMIRTYLSAIDDTPHPFALYLPPGMDRSKRYPLVVSLHGAYSNYANNLRRLLGVGNRPGEPDELALAAMPMQPKLPDVDFIILCPWGMGTMGYYGPGERDVRDVLDLVMKDYPIDENRVYLTGLSMGGSGTWELGLRYPDTWAALAPVCAVAGFERWVRMDKAEDAAPGFLQDIVRRRTVTRLVENALNVPVYVFHNDDDPVVPVEQSRDMIARLKGAGANAAYFEFHGGGHNAWDPTYQRARLLDWFAPHARMAKPNKVVYNTAWYKYRRAWWVEVTGLTGEPTPGRIAAEVTGGNRIAIETEGIDGFKLYPDRAPLENPAGLQVTVNGRAVQAGAGGAISFLSADGKRFTAGEPPFDRSAKGPGLEGPIGSILDDRVILVYGEGDTRAEAIRFADWGELAEVNFLIRRDVDLTEEDIKGANLVLFGDPETNRIIARVGDRLPLRFEAGSIRLGKLGFPREGTAVKLVYPNPLAPDRLLMINSNDSWNYDRIWSYMTRLMTLPDYIVYRAGGWSLSQSEVLASGFFDRHWRLPEKAR